MEHRSDFAGDSGLRKPVGPRQVAATAEAVRDAKIEIVFLATPAEVSMELAPTMLDAGARVIDLSGAFRLRTVENYARWYREAHTQPALLAEMWRLCRPGGLLWLDTPNQFALCDQHDTGLYFVHWLPRPLKTRV